MKRFSMKKILAFLSLAVAATAGSGCATIISGKTQQVSFKSLPPGATVTVNGQRVGVTPVVAEVKRDKASAVVIHKEGCEDDRFTLDHSWNAWMLGNFIFGGLPLTPLSCTTDRQNGANVEYDPDHYYSVLDPSGTEATMSRADARRHRLARFIAVSDAQLSQDIAAGEGEYLDAVWQILAIPKDRRDDDLKKLRDIRARYKKIPDFAEAAGRALVAN